MLLIFLAFATQPLGSQEAIYRETGLRIALFNFQVISIKNNSLVVKCQVANTGRLPVGAAKTAVQTIVEIDTFNLPPILWGHEITLSEAAKNNMPRLKPGEVSAPVWLSVKPTAPVAASNLQTCIDIRVDTAYLRRLDADKMMVSVIIRNNGQQPAEIDGAGGSLGLNFYFVSGKKLTRGAIPAGNLRVSNGRETLTGWLKPQQKIQVDLEVSLENRTKFSPNLLLELAIPSKIQDCFPANNTCVLYTDLNEKGM